MIFKNFTINVVVRVLLLLTAMGLLMHTLIISQLYIRSFYLGVFVVAATTELIYYVGKTNRDISNFLKTILQNDFTNTYYGKEKGKSFAHLYKTFNAIIEKFQLLGEARESEHQYLQMLVEHVQVGILSFNQEGQIHLMNSAMKKLLGLKDIHNLSGLEQVDAPLTNLFRSIQPGENKLHKSIIENKLMQLAIYASEFRLKEKWFKLVSVQNIKAELEANEMEAWQKLIRVLTHEIMNSVSPISSLSDTLHKMVQNENHAIDAGLRENLDQGLQAIKIRSQSLQNFTEAYKSLTRIPQPVLKRVSVSDWLMPLLKLFENETQKKNIAFSVSIENDLHIIGDPELLGQVIVNLMRNALEAVEMNSPKEISITARKVAEKVIIEIWDNGSGIEPEVMDKIFIPFFTTKKNGSGIGLALSKQILQLHQAEVQVESNTSGTTFRIRL